MLESWKAPLINFCLWGGIALEWVKEPRGADRRLIETWIMDISGYLKEVLREDWMEWNIIRGLLIDYCVQFHEVQFSISWFQNTVCTAHVASFYLLLHLPREPRAVGILNDWGNDHDDFHWKLGASARRFVATGSAEGIDLPDIFMGDFWWASSPPHQETWPVILIPSWSNTKWATKTKNIKLQNRLKSYHTQ